MEITHRSSRDPLHQVDAPFLKTYKCVGCDQEAHTFDTSTPFCEPCQKYMVLDRTVSSTKVREIKNRTVKSIGTPDEEQTKKGRLGRYTDNLIKKELRAVVRPHHGSPVMLLEINMDRESFMKGLILLQWGDYSTVTSLQEIGKAFTPFDPTPYKVLQDKPDGTLAAVSLERTPHKGVSKIGEISVTGGKNKRFFDEGLVVFKHGTKEATFGMTDIALVLHYAI